MSEVIGGDERLSELIWRTTKLRVSLLVITNLILLVVWSAMAGGKKHAHQIDVEYCQKLIAQTSRDSSTVTFSPETLCTPRRARDYVEGTRATQLPILFRLCQGLAADASKKDNAERLLKLINERRATLAEYDDKRHDAFPLQLELTSELTGSGAVMNGQTAAEFVPFCVLIMLAIVILLGFQQAAYKEQLVSRIGHGGDSDELIAEWRRRHPKAQ